MISSTYTCFLGSTIYLSLVSAMYLSFLVSAIYFSLCDSGLYVNVGEIVVLEARHYDISWLNGNLPTILREWWAKIRTIVRSAPLMRHFTIFPVTHFCKSFGHPFRLCLVYVLVEEFIYHEKRKWLGDQRMNLIVSRVMFSFSSVNLCTNF